MAFRFVHTADLHLDSPLVSLALRDPELAELVGTATRTVLARIVDLCLAERVDALLVAGDLYDRDQTSMKTAGFLARQFARLTGAGIRVFLIRGNHDAAARISGELRLPEGAHLFGPRDAPVVLEGAADGRDVAVHGASFRRIEGPADPLAAFAAPVAGALNVAMLHTKIGRASCRERVFPVV